MATSPGSRRESSQRLLNCHTSSRGYGRLMRPAGGRRRPAPLDVSMDGAELATGACELPSLELNAQRSSGGVAGGGVMRLALVLLTDGIHGNVSRPPTIDES